MRQVNHHKNIIEVKNVSFAYSGEDVLCNVSINIHQGDYLGFVGPNGGGKTTLLKIILGLLEPGKGEIKLFGKKIKNFKDWPKIAYVAQRTDNFDDNFPATVYETVLMGRYGRCGLFHSITAKDREVARLALKQADMLEYQDRLIGDLSGGQRQRVFIARALAGEPEVIFLDEPTTGIDHKSQDDFYTLLKKMNEEMGITLVLISHDIEKIVKEAMHIACIDHTLTCHSSPEEFLNESETTRLFGRDIKTFTHHHN
jgi:zinc transport system ATP-binding protein